MFSVPSPICCNSGSHRRHNRRDRFSKQLKTNKFVAAGSVSRILSASRSLQDGHSSRPHIAVRLKRPTRNFHPIAGSPKVDAPSRRVRALLSARSLFGLAPCGVCHAPSIAGRAVRSYRTFSPLPRPKPRRYVLCGTGRRLALTPASRTLSGTLLCGVRTFLAVSHICQKKADMGHPATVRSGCQL
jgi:hypothetical protein